MYILLRQLKDFEAGIRSSILNNSILELLLQDVIRETLEYFDSFSLPFSLCQSDIATQNRSAFSLTAVGLP